MKRTFNELGAGGFTVGEKVQISEDGCTKLPVSPKGGEEALFIQTKNGYRLISMVPDVKRVYIEVTTKCNFACITCIRSSWQDELAHMDCRVLNL